MFSTTEKAEKVSMSSGIKVKCVLIGDMFVGKTSLARVFVSGHFQENYSVSCGGTFMAKTLREPPLTMQIWDTAGMERFRSMLPHFLREATCAFFVFDLSERRTFLTIRDFWIDYVKENILDDKIVMVLVGNKTDKQSRQVKESDARGLADHYGMQYFETSAKTSHNVQNLFRSTANRIIECGAYRSNFHETNPLEPKVLPSLSPPKKKWKCCPLS